MLSNAALCDVQAARQEVQQKLQTSEETMRRLTAQNNSRDQALTDEVAELSQQLESKQVQYLHLLSVSLPSH